MLCQLVSRLLSCTPAVFLIHKIIDLFSFYMRLYDICSYHKFHATRSDLHTYIKLLLQWYKSKEWYKHQYPTPVKQQAEEKDELKRWNSVHVIWLSPWRREKGSRERGVTSVCIYLILFK